MMVSVIIVNWNTPDLALAAAHSALSQVADEAVEVIVVDNASTDDSLARLRAEQDLRLLAAPRNLGFAGGNNLALRRARGDWTLLLNSDAELRPGALAELLRAARAEPRAALVAPLVESPDGSVQWHWDYMPGLLREVWLVLVGRRLTASATWQQRALALREPVRVRSVGTAALLAPMWLWRRIGLLPEEGFLYFEEADLCERVRRRGWPILLAPAARALHHGGQSTGQVPARRRRAHYESRMLFYDRHRDPCSAALVRWLSRLRAAYGLWRDESADELWRPVWRAAR